MVWIVLITLHSARYFYPLSHPQKIANARLTPYIKVMKIIGNIIWVIFGGLFLAIQYFISSLLLMITIIGIPFGLQTMKLAGLALWPFGREVRTKESGTGCLSTLMNLLWILLGAWLIALEHALIGLFFCITIIGIPFGMQHFKLAAIALTPFGREVV